MAVLSLSLIHIWAKEIGEESTSAKSLGLVGTSASLTSLNEGILEQLEYEGILCRRAPLSEMMLFLWKDCLLYTSIPNAAKRKGIAKCIRISYKGQFHLCTNLIR